MTTGKPVVAALQAYSTSSWDEETLVGTRNGAFHVRALKYPGTMLKPHYEPPKRRIAERGLRAMSAVPYELRDGMLHHEFAGFGPLPATIGTREVIALGYTTGAAFKGPNTLHVHWKCQCGESRRTLARRWQSTYQQALQRGNVSEARCGRCHRKKWELHPARRTEASFISAPTDGRARARHR